MEEVNIMARVLATRMDKAKKDYLNNTTPTVIRPITNNQNAITLQK